jgi:hypothetical protein
MRAVVAQLVEHFLGKEEVSGSSPDNGSSLTLKLDQELGRRSGRGCRSDN